MYKLEVPHKYVSPDAQFHAEGIVVEIASFVPPDDTIYNCVSHHVLLSWVFPRPVMGQGGFCTSDGLPKLAEIGTLNFSPAFVPTVSRYCPKAGARRVIVVRFAPEILDRLAEDETGRLDLGSMASYNIRAPEIQYSVHQLAKETLAPGFASKMLVESVGSAMLVQLARRVNRSSSDRKGVRGGLAPWQMRRIKERIVDQSAESIPSLSELAELAGISAGHLRRAFKQSEGCTIGDYIRDVRVEYARTLLSDTDLPLGEISMRLGFSAQNGFSVAFQRVAGETPSAFRQRLRAGS